MPIFLSLFLVFCFWLHYEKNKSHRIHKETTASFIKQERDANLARKKDISDLEYVSLSLTSLPMEAQEDAQITRYQELIRSYQDQKMVNLSSFDNTALKLAYGIGNFELLSTYDETYYSFARLLDDWGTYLYEKQQFTDAKEVLEYAWSIRSDLPTTYLTLAKTYASLQDVTKLQTLVQYANDELSSSTPSFFRKLEKIHTDTLIQVSVQI